MFGGLVLRAGIEKATDIYAMSGAALEVLAEAQRHGIKTTLEQPSAPCAVEISIMEEEYRNWPGWEESRKLTGVFDEFSRREQAEWKHADTIVCPSQFVADGIRQAGGPSDRCRIVPYGVAIPPQSTRRVFSDVRARPLRVLSVGGVRLQKGTQYVLEAAKRANRQYEFKWVGPIMVKPRAEQILRSRLQLTGAVPRFEVDKFYEWADVFLLPSLSEGSAIVVYEALARGIPVICTANTGSVVRDGTEGFVVPIRDSAAIAACLEKLAANPDLLATMATNAYARSKEFSIAAYADRLLAAISPSACS
jgi:glycosyltransferase involved in cell wall biosynthesis